MSAKKTTNTKIIEDTEQDSGFLSGPIDVLPGDSGEITDIAQSDEIKVKSVSEESCEPDSGLIEVTESLSAVDLKDTPLQAPVILDKRPLAQFTPLTVLFNPDHEGDTQLHIAAENGCEKAVSILIRLCPNKEWFNFPNDFGQTALHLATMSGNAVVTRMLVIAGASLAARDNRGETPLHKATLLCNVECIKALLNPLKERPQTKISTVLNQKNYNGQACVHLAASLGHIETLQTLVYYGADVNARENLAGWTPLHIAAQRGHAALATHLCQRAGGGSGGGGGVDARARDYAGRSPRRLARRSAAAAVFAHLPDNSDSESDDDDDDMYDSDTETLFKKFQEDSFSSPIVA